MTKAITNTTINDSSKIPKEPAVFVAIVFIFVAAVAVAAAVIVGVEEDAVSFCWDTGVGATGVGGATCSNAYS